ncbi:hypothetical protein [Halorientalis salina]|uniref:hypothetical protein n=1 Tax=Halorientalis salina TaxID=2932266 RepID=UPI0010AC9B79|nr:hypothetical protein [Halorientalis salina]
MSLLLVLAGCNGGGQTTETTAETTGTAAETTDGEMETADGDEGDVQEPELGSYEFTEGESYTYTETLLGTPVQKTWSVVSVDGDNVTVTVTSSGPTENATVTASQDSIVDRMSQESIGENFGAARLPLAIVSMGDTSSEDFTIESDALGASGSQLEWETATVSPQGGDSVAGVECSAFEVDADDTDERYDFCIAEDYPFAVSFSYEQGGQTALAMELTNATRP